MFTTNRDPIEKVKTDDISPSKTAPDRPRKKSGHGVEKFK